MSSPGDRRTRATVRNMEWTPLRLGARRRPNLAAVHRDDPTSIKSYLHGHVIEWCVGTRFTPCHEGSYLPTSKDWCFWSELSSCLPGLMSLSYPGFLLKGGTICDLIRLHSHWELSPLLPVPPLGHIYSCMSSSAFTAVGNLLLFRLINRWDKI